MKKFNITGLCIPEKHYVVDTSKKIEKTVSLIDAGEYFTINRARQYGKTTTLYLLQKRLQEKYCVLDISFEGIGDTPFRSQEDFCHTFINLIEAELVRFEKNEAILKLWIENRSAVTTIEQLSAHITRLCKSSQQDVVLLIDEIDKCSDNQLFLHFLGMLRRKYLSRNAGKDFTFKSVILAGVYDVKNMKLKLRPGEEPKFNSPWNIASDFDLEMSFNPDEIASMLIEYEEVRKTGMNITQISNEIYFYTSGYPFLVSNVCKVIAEKLNDNWSIQGIKDAVNVIVEQKSTLTDDLIKNLENNPDLYEMTKRIIVDDEMIDYVHTNATISFGSMFGIFEKTCDKKVKVHNKIFEVIIYNHLISSISELQQYNNIDYIHRK